MARRWMGVALSILWLGIPISARAQYLPTSGSPTAMPEPLPVSGGPGPMMGAAGPLPCGPMPGPGPLGPPPLRPDAEEGPNAWTADEGGPSSNCHGYCCNAAWSLSLGSVGYKRERVPSLPLAVLDPQNLDTGVPPPVGSPIIEDTHNLPLSTYWGVKATLGYQWENQVIEITGFYVPQANNSHSIANPGRIDLPFFNPPLGFEGDNGLWLQADDNTITLQTSLSSAEFNYRWGTTASCFQWLVGVRYLDVQEKFSIFTDDDGLTVSPPDPFRMATYSVRAHNHILGPQLGFDFEQEICPWLSLGFFGKGVWGANFVDVDTSLKRGDGFVGFTDHRDKTQFGHAYELGLFLDVFFNDHIRLRGGYNALWVVNVAEAIQQTNFDLSMTTGTATSTGSIFYHGPVIELSVLF